MAAVSELLKSCYIQFNSLIASDGLAKHNIEVPLQAWKDELGRLRVWAANLNDQTEISSLDYHLRDASHIKDQILSLLERVKELLSDLTEVLEEDTDKNLDPYEGVEGLGDYPEEDDGYDGGTETQQIYQDLLDTITHLHQMSMKIRHPAHHDRLVGVQKVDAQPFIFWAKQHVSNKYPHANELLIDRLSFMMARQRAILKYRERRHAKLSHSIDPRNKRPPMQPKSPLSDVYEGSNWPDEVASDTGVSETSYNGTLPEGIDGHTKLPPIPREGRGKYPFKCPYCFYTITVQDDQAWKRHILRDLMPYVCIFLDCPIPNRLYERCQQWYTHVQQTHPIGDASYECAICKRENLPPVEFKQHMAGHLQDLALFYLPRVRSDGEKGPGMRQEERAQGVNAKQNWQTNSLIKHATNLPWELTEESTQKPYKASTYDAGRALLGIPSSYPPSYRSDENTKHNKEQSPRALHRPLDDDSWDNLWKHESLTDSGSDFDFDTAISYPRIEENKLSRKGIPLVSHYNYYSPPAASIASPYSTSIGSTYPTSLASTYLTTPNSSVQTSADKPAQVARALWPPSKLNNYLGLCKGAWKVQSGFRGFKFYSEPGPGCYTITSALRCVECAFEGPLPLDLSREHPKFEDNVRTHKASGVRYRFEFLAKSHVPYRRDAASHIAPDSPRGAFCCMLCCVAHGSMQIYEDLDIFMAHLAEQHWDIGRDTLAVLPGIRCVVSRVAPDSEEFDLNIPPGRRLS